MSSVYMIHFDRPLNEGGHMAQHYIGYTGLPIEVRMARHRTKDGAKILRACELQGIAYRVVRVWEGGDYELEHRLKSRKNAASLCPICQKEMAEGIQPIKATRYEMEILKILGSETLDLATIENNYLAKHPRAHLKALPERLQRMEDSGLIDHVDGFYRQTDYLREMKI